MNNSKKKILIGIAVILLLVTLIVIFLGNREKEPIDNKNNGTPVAEISKTFSKVNDYKEYFSIENTISQTLALTEAFFAKEIYTNNDSTTRYYFVNGCITEVLMDDETTNYNKSVNYLLIVGMRNNNYEIVNLSNNISDLLDYAKKYDVKHQEINTGQRLANGIDNIQNILITYIEYFKEMLFFDPELAYNMLTADTKNKYLNYADFYNQIPDVYNNLSSAIFAYSKKEKEDIIEYYIKDDSQNDIKIIEYDIMNFKISY